MTCRREGSPSFATVSAMKTFVVLVVGEFVLAGSAPSQADKPKPKFPLGKDTTVVVGPLDADGYVDYEAVLNARFGKGVTPATNACAGLWPA
jgi:hypothetical protein